MNITAIGLGIIMSLVYTELVGYFCGGIISAGYLAQFIREPLRIIMTVTVALSCFCIVKFFSHHMILYGKRRFAIVILLSFILGRGMEQILVWTDFFYNVHYELRAVGYIIPGLIAHDMLRQGIVPTLLSLAAVTLTVALAMLVAV